MDCFQDNRFARVRNNGIQSSPSLQSGCHCPLCWVNALHVARGERSTREKGLLVTSLFVYLSLHS